MFWGYHHLRKPPHLNQPLIFSKHSCSKLPKREIPAAKPSGAPWVPPRREHAVPAGFEHNSPPRNPEAKHLPGRINRDEWIFTEKWHENCMNDTSCDFPPHGCYLIMIQTVWSLHHSLEPEIGNHPFFMNAWPIFQPIIPTAAFLSSGFTIQSATTASR